MQHYGDDDLVLVVLGDHQPWTIASGQRESRRAISAIAHDRTVLDRIAFRDRFLSAFGQQPATRRSS